MNLEAVMAIILIAMVAYFIKSTDLPKEQRERSKLLAEDRKRRSDELALKKINFAKFSQKKKTVTLNKKMNENEIDELSLKITALEEELQENNKKSKRIKNLIDAHLEKISSFENHQLH